MIDPVLRLALAIESGKGVYALLLGSGVSRASAIPTGWEVVLDLIRKLARLKGESCDPDPEVWYKSLVGSEPDYSDVLDQITSSSAERGQLLRSYFEPTQDDREQGRKAPSSAHRAIASLVSKGYIRVIVTTNFDRLMEQALVDAGVQPTIISTPDAVRGAMPLTHSPCTVIKIHGDYLDSRLRNTKRELSTYEKPFDELLDRVFDEFGLVVCGWSAEWDTALRGALERCSTHRFGTYWTAYKSTLTGEAEKLIAARRAVVMSIADADSFFKDLAEKTQALEDLTLTDPISSRVAVARMKRYLADPQQRINLHDLLSAETERVHFDVRTSRFSTNDNHLTPERVVERLRAYEAGTQTLVAMLACGGYWATDERQFRRIGATVKRLADDPTPKEGFTIWINLQLYPALLALYATGVTAVASGNYGFLCHIFELKISRQRDRPEQNVAEILTTLEAMDRSHQQQFLPGRQREFTPLNNYLFEALRLSIRDYIPDDNGYDRAFDAFEYLLGLAYGNATTSEAQLKEAVSDFYIRGPVGRFLWRNRHSDAHIQKLLDFEPGGPYPEMVDGLVHAGMFNSREHFRLVKHGFDAFIGKVREGLGRW
jgi:hypothetical protein